MRGKKHPDELQSQVIAALLAGQGVGEVAAQYNLDKSVVSRWKTSLPSDKLQQIATKTAEKGEQIEEALFGYLIETLTTLKEQVIIAREREYVIKQPAGEFAVLHGVMADKAVRLLEAAERARAPRSVEADSPTIG